MGRSGGCGHGAPGDHRILTLRQRSVSRPPPTPGHGGPCLRAIILAAGAGTRLRPLTEGRPKCLVPVAGRALIDRQLQVLAGMGVRDVVVVAGFEAGQVRAHLRGRARCVVNDDWERTNSMESLHRARRCLEGDTLLLNCDILFRREAVERLGTGPGSCLAVDSRAPRQAGEMNVRIGPSGLVTGIGKHLDPARCQAVSAQLVRFDGAGSVLVRREVDRLVGAGGGGAFPPSAYGPLIRSGGLRAVETGDLPWFEIDSLEDYERAVGQLGPGRPGGRPR